MTNKKETENEVEKVNQPDNAPIAPEGNVVPSPEVLSHQWQKDSPAINTNAVAGYEQESFIDKTDPELMKAKAEAEEKRQEDLKEELSEFDYKSRTKLDVSDPRYLNPSQDYAVKKGK